MKDAVLYLFCRNRFETLRLCLLHLYANDLSRIDICAVDDASEDDRVVPLLEHEWWASRLRWLKHGWEQRLIGVRRKQATAHFLRRGVRREYMMHLDSDMFLAPHVAGDALALFDALRKVDWEIKPLGEGVVKGLRIGALSLTNLGQTNRAVGQFHSPDQMPYRTLERFGEAFWISRIEAIEQVGTLYKLGKSGETEPWFDALTGKHAWHYVLAPQLGAHVVHAGAWESCISGKRQTPFMTYTDLDGRTPASVPHLAGEDLRRHEPDWAALYESIKGNFPVKPGE